MDLFIFHKPSDGCVWIYLPCAPDRPRSYLLEFQLSWPARDQPVRISMEIPGSNTWRYVLKYHNFRRYEKKRNFPWKVWAWNIGQTYMVGTSVLNRFLSHDHWHEMFYPLVYTLNWQLSTGNMMILCSGSNGENLLELCRQTQIGDTLWQFYIAMV